MRKDLIRAARHCPVDSGGAKSGGLHHRCTGRITSVVGHISLIAYITVVVGQRAAIVVVDIRHVVDVGGVVHITGRPWTRHGIAILSGIVDRRPTDREESRPVAALEADR
jgi:hypothetical protein